MTSNQDERYLLTIACNDVVGIVAAVAGFLAQRKLFITESSHYGDPQTCRFFMRTSFVPQTEAFSPTEFKAAYNEIASSFDMTWSLHDVRVPPRICIMVSQFGHCLNDLLYRQKTGALAVNITAIVSNHLDFAPLAQAHNIPFIHLPVTTQTKPRMEERLFELLEETDTELLVLARYMQILSDAACTRLAGHAINIHHSFLPSFKGARPYHQAHARGVKLIGATAHFVSPQLDEGPIIEQMVTPVTHSVDVKEMIARGRDIESIVLARAVKAYAERRIFLNGNKTVIF